MRRAGLFVLVMGLLVAACSGGDEDAQEPHEMADELFQAAADGDNETWRDMYSDEAVVVSADGTSFALFGDFEWVVDDFDGDGVTSFADQLQTNNALHEPAGQTMDWECSTVAVNQCECTVTASDAFIEAGGGAPLVSETTLTFEEGKIISELEPQPLDPATAGDSIDAFFTTSTSYERWVRETYPDRYPTMFHEPCCEYSMILLPDSVAQHTDLMPEYFTTLE